VEAVAVAVEPSLAASESAVLLVTLAVLLIVLPRGPPALALSTGVKVALAPAARAGAEALRVPVPPAGDSTRLSDGPEDLRSETKAVPAGTASESVTPRASPGPPLLRVRASVALAPAVTAAGPAWLTARSAAALAVVSNVAVSLVASSVVVVVKKGGSRTIC
jgi:hypothetical protein